MANTVPNNMKIGTALGFVGGVIALVAMAASWNADIGSMYLVGINMLVAVMFFAAAGTFTKYSPVCGNTVVVLSGLAGAVTIIAAIYGATELWVSVILLVIAVVLVAIAACPHVSKWVDSNRVI